MSVVKDTDWERELFRFVRDGKRIADMQFL